MGATAAFDAGSSNFETISYALTGDGAATTTTAITCSGAASPDLITDVNTARIIGPPRSVARCKADGLGVVIPRGVALSQGVARAMYNCDGDPGGNDFLPRLRMQFTPRTGLAIWAFDIDVDGGGNAIVRVQTNAVAGTGILRFITQIGRRQNFPPVVV